MQSRGIPGNRTRASGRSGFVGEGNKGFGRPDLGAGWYCGSDARCESGRGGQGQRSIAESLVLVILTEVIPLIVSSPMSMEIEFRRPSRRVAPKLRVYAVRRKRFWWESTPESITFRKRCRAVLKGRTNSIRCKFSVAARNGFPVFKYTKFFGISICTAHP